jgi:GNAT superfamily N-acetyltransferase
MNAGMLVRPIAPSDEASYRTILEATTAEDRYCRFFHAVDHLDPDEVHRFVEKRADLIGVIAHDGTVPLGAAHAALLDAETAELAIVVARDARHHGVGTALLNALIGQLTARGYRRLIACALRENHPLTHLVKHAGFAVERADGQALRWVLPLSPGEGSVAR